MSALTSLEKQVLDMLLAGDEEPLGTLREQVRLSSVSSREMSGVGFFTHFAVPMGAPLLSGKRRFQLGDVYGEATNLKHGAGFVLFVNEGAIDFLEGFTYDEPWPNEVQGLQVMYPGEKGRDLLDLRKTLYEV